MRITERNKTDHTLSKMLEIAYKETTIGSNITRDDSTLGHHQMVNTKIKLITFFVAKDGEAVYSQQKLTVAQIISFS